MEKHKDIQTEARKLSWIWQEGIDQNQGGCWGHSGLSERRINNDDKSDLAGVLLKYSPPRSYRKKMNWKW